MRSAAWSRDPALWRCSRAGRSRHWESGGVRAECFGLYVYVFGHKLVPSFCEISGPAAGTCGGGRWFSGVVMRTPFSVGQASYAAFGCGMLPFAWPSDCDEGLHAMARDASFPTTSDSRRLLDICTNQRCLLGGRFGQSVVFVATCVPVSDPLCKFTTVIAPTAQRSGFRTDLNTVISRQGYLQEASRGVYRHSCISSSWADSLISLHHRQARPGLRRQPPTPLHTFIAIPARDVCGL